MKEQVALGLPLYRNQEALVLLAGASELLANSSDYTAVFDKATQLFVENLATWCAVDILNESGQVERVAVVHRDNAYESLTKEILLKYPAKPTAKRGVYRVIETGTPILIPKMTQEDWALRADSPEHLRILMALGCSSYMCIPLIARGKSIGSIMLFSDERTFDAFDLKVSESFVASLATAIDNINMSRQMENATKVRNDFLNTLSHELKTPIHIINSWLSLLKTEKLNETIIKQAFEVIDQNFRLQENLVNDLLDASRILSGTFAVNRTIVDLGTIARLAIQSVSLLATEKNISIYEHFASEPQYLFGDATQLERMLFNLLSNAIKFTSSGGAIGVEFSTTENKLCLLIKDNGIGLSPNFIGHAFEPFRQADGTSTREHDGLGLGLTIVKHIVHLHGGKIRLASPGAGMGTEATIEFPKMKRNPTSQIKQQNQHTEELSSHPLIGVRILLVDDVEEMRIVLSRILKRSGAEVESSPSAADAFIRFQKFRPDILISDIAMPGEDGHSLIKKIRHLPVDQGGKTCAVALSANMNETERLLTIESGFNSHFSKPISYQAFIADLCRLVGR